MCKREVWHLQTAKGDLHNQAVSSVRQDEEWRPCDTFEPWQGCAKICQELFLATDPRCNRSMSP